MTTHRPLGEQPPNPARLNASLLAQADRIEPRHPGAAHAIRGAVHDAQETQ